ncbi:unnamed protein product [Orchesella dallaii]|uniref:Geminin n=1 Tax=Orchesella dallaii TaxID=48710 RepID=A0ABP1QV00_9HEXA
MGRGDVEAVDQENATAVKRSSSIGTTNQKSFIPVKVTSKNEKASLSPATPLSLKTRKPLGQLQTGQSPQTKTLPEKGTPKEGKAVERIPMKTDRGSLTQIIGKSRSSSDVPNTPHNSPKKLTVRKSLIGKNKKAEATSTSETAEIPDVLKAQDEVDSLSYWKELAESRRQALESALQENYELHQRVEKLEEDNAELEELVKDAKKLATLIDDWKNDLDESGIGGDTEEEKQ